MPPPALRLADRLRTSARLAVLVGVLVVPAAAATTGFASVTSAQIAFSSAERGGVVDLGPALDELVRAARTGDVGAAGLAADRVTGIGNSSNLILDPDLDSFYVMDALVVQVPRAMVALARVAGDPSQTGDARVAARAVDAGTLTSAAASLRGDVETAVASTADPALAGPLAGLVSLADALDAAALAVTDDLSSPSGVDPGAAAAAADRASGPALAALDGLVGARVAGLERRRASVLTVTVVALLLALWFAAAVWWRTREDVGLLLTSVTALADGDTTPRPLPQGRDELGDVGRALARTAVELARGTAELEASRARQVAQFELSFAQQQYTETQVRRRAQGVVDETAGVVVGDLDEVRGQVDAVRGAAGTIDDRVAATDELTREVVRHTREAEQVAGALSESLRQVAGVTRLISGVAEQTKLLALNATIEAARAGEAGKGFSVVAGEVKALALATARSTEEITATIGTLERDAARMATTVATVATSISGVDESAAVLADVASRQRELVDSLDARVRTAIERVRGMSDITASLERRQTVRVPVSGPVVVRTPTAELHGELRDVGEGGLRCAVPSLLQLGETVTVQAQLGGRALRVGGAVSHAQRDAGGRAELGLRFVDPDDDALGVLRAAVGRAAATP